MISLIETLDKEILGTVKVQRYKTLKTASSYTSGLMITKVMTFASEESLTWIEQELHYRVQTLCSVQKMSYIQIQLNQVLEAFLKIEQKQKTLYLTKRFITGYSLSDLFQHEQQYSKINTPANAKELVWDILAILLCGKGFNNLIVTHQNLLFELSGVQGYKPNINYLSFVGFKFLRFKEDIDVSQYKQIAIFLDQEALNSGNIDRFEFKVRNFACLILILVVGDDLSDFLLKNTDLGNTVTIKKAKSLHEQNIQPRLQQLIKMKEIREKIDALQIVGLSDFMSQAFNLKQNKLNWSQIQSLLTRNILSFPKKEQLRQVQRSKKGRIQNLNLQLCKMAKQCWQLEDQDQKSILISKGMHYIQSNPLVYLALKIGVSLQTLLRDNKWEFLGDQKYNRWKRELFHQLIEIHLNMKKKNEQRTTYLLNLGKSVLGYVDEIDKKPVLFISHQKKTLMGYEDL